MDEGSTSGAQEPGGDRAGHTGVGLDHWGANFPETHWSLLVAGGDGVEEFSTRAFAEMSGRYWYPLYAFARRQGMSAEDAQDATQGFLEYLVSGDRLKNVRQERGKLRSYLLGAMKHYLSGVRDRDRAQKRGGGQLAISIDEEQAEQRYQNEPSHDETPETLFDRGWAMEILQQVLDRIEAEFLAKGKGAQYEVLQPQLTGEGERGDYREAAEKLGESEANVRVIVMRMRKRFRELLRQLIRETVSTAEEVEEELGQLMAALG